MGKEVLKKSVAQAIPNYAMSCFKLPRTFCSEMESIIANFWWGNSESNKGIHWKSWQLLCSSKSNGGLGFRNFEAFNEALLAKQLWRIHSHPDTLLAKILKARYFPSKSLWDTEVGYQPSYAWRSIWGARKLLEKGVRWRIGNGQQVRIWQDKWLGDGGSGKIITPRSVFEVDARVSLLIDPENCSWRNDVLAEVFFSIDVDNIRNIPISQRLPCDERVWTGSVDGVFRVRDAYRIALESENFSSSSSGHDPIWRIIWGLKLPPKVKNYMWRACYGIAVGPQGFGLGRGVLGANMKPQLFVNGWLLQ